MHKLALIVGFAFLALAALIAVTNFGLVFIRPLYFHLRKQKYKFVSTIPIVGNLLLIFASLLLPANTYLRYAAIGIVLLDTGGLPWILVMLIWNRIYVWKKGTD